MSDTSTAVSDRKARAYVSGTAARAFVVRDGETFMLQPAAPEPVACAPALMANTLALCSDVAVYPTSEEPPFCDVHADLGLRVRVSACTDYLTALLDPTLSDDLRAHASYFANELLAQESIAREIERIFLNVVPPIDADVAGAHLLAASHTHTSTILSGIRRAGRFARRLEKLWERQKMQIPSLADRNAADAFFRQRSLIAKALEGVDQASLAAGAEPPLREAFERWAAAAHAFAKALELYEQASHPQADFPSEPGEVGQSAMIQVITVRQIPLEPSDVPKRRGR